MSASGDLMDALEDGVVVCGHHGVRGIGSDHQRDRRQRVMGFPQSFGRHDDRDRCSRFQREHRGWSPGEPLQSRVRFLTCAASDGSHCRMNVERLQPDERTIKRRQEDRSRRGSDDGRGGGIRLSKLCERGNRHEEQERHRKSRDARAFDERHARWPLNPGANRDEAKSRRFSGDFRLSVPERGKSMGLYGRAIPTQEEISTRAATAWRDV